jgi:hypothetical protein
VKTRAVTAKTVREAARIGELVGAAAMADRSVICRVADDDCCGHVLEDYCVAAAIGASDAAVCLWLRASNAVATPRRERAAEIADAATPADKQRITDLYAWVDGMCGSIPDLAVAELTTAALLREGNVPPGWKIRRPRRRAR